MRRIRQRDVTLLSIYQPIDYKMIKQLKITADTSKIHSCTVNCVVKLSGVIYTVNQKQNKQCVFTEVFT